MREDIELRNIERILEFDINTNKFIKANPLFTEPNKRYALLVPGYLAQPNTLSGIAQFLSRVTEEKTGKCLYDKIFAYRPAWYTKQFIQIGDDLANAILMLNEKNILIDTYAHSRGWGMLRWALEVKNIPLHLVKNAFGICGANYDSPVILVQQNNELIKLFKGVNLSRFIPNSEDRYGCNLDAPCTNLTHNKFFGCVICQKENKCKKNECTLECTGEFFNILNNLNNPEIKNRRYFLLAGSGFDKLTVFNDVPEGFLGKINEVIYKSGNCNVEFLVSDGRASIKNSWGISVLENKSNFVKENKNFTRKLVDQSHFSVWGIKENQSFLSPASSLPEDVKEILIEWIEFIIQNP
jgi:hypothetical protein